jgi:type IV secretory pathway VirB10-like protein
MSIRLGGSKPGASATRPPLVVALAFGVAAVAVGAIGLWVMFGRNPVVAAPMAPEGEKLAAQGAARRAQSLQDANRLRQQEIGEGYEFDATGQLVGARPDTADLPQNRPLAPTSATAVPEPAPLPPEVSAGVHHERGPGSEGGTATGKEDGAERELLRHSMLGYSTVRSASWATRRPEASAVAPAGERPAAAAGHPGDDQVLRGMERLIDAATPAGALGSAGGGVAAAGPARSGDALYPAERAPQVLGRGGPGDMRIGSGVGPDAVIRQGKFLDCALVNELQADLVESPVVAMVSRDFLSLDGAYVLVPAGAKLLGTAGTVQNVQQARVYIKFDRILFPDQRSAFFPVRQVGAQAVAVDGMGAVGVTGDVDRHFVLQFGAAVMLGVLDGLAAAVQGPTMVSSPPTRDLVLARTSGNLAMVLGGILQRYGNVVPTVTVQPGAKMKVFFGEDVLVTPYMRTRDLAWMR